MVDFVIPVKTIVKCLATICIILACLLLIWPNLLIKMNLFSKTWFSTAEFEQKLNRTRDIDTHLLNMRKVLGIIAIALALVFILILFRQAG